MVDPNTRQGKRTPVTLKIKFKSETLEQFIERYAVDVSQGGIFIRTKEPLAVGTQMRFEFQLRDASPLIAGEGTVVWTRENDPSRPAIAPGMGVRFDRLAEGSQSVLERILAEKAKQAPQRPAAETTKPPMFTDTPTRVAPAPVQEALLGNDSTSQRKRADSFTDNTPLPKPTPWHSDADEFPEEAFEEQTKVRALDELIAQTADAGGASASPSDELALRRRGDATVADPPDAHAHATALATAKQVLVDRDSAPGLPSPPEPATRSQPPRMLDASPALAAPSGDGAKTRLGMEPAKAIRPGSSPSTPPSNQSNQDIRSADTKASGIRAIAAEPAASARIAAKPKSIAPMAILLLLLVAVSGAALWFFVIRDRAADDAIATKQGGGSAGSGGSGSHHQPSDVVQRGGGDGSAGSAGSAADANGSADRMVGSAAPIGPTVDTLITANADKATIEIEGTGQSGPSPFKAKLEKGKPYKAKVAAPGFLTQELDVQGGTDKVPAKLVAKPRVVIVSSDPPGALIYVDSSATGHSTPFDVELTKAQAAKKSVRVMIKKSGYKAVEKVVDFSKMTEDATQIVFKIDERLQVQINITTNTGNTGNHPPAGSNTGSGHPPDGSAAGSGSSAPDGSGGSGNGGNGGSGATPGSATGSAPAPAAAPKDPPKAGSGTPKDGPKAGTPEPEPDFLKKP